MSVLRIKDDVDEILEKDPKDAASLNGFAWLLSLRPDKPPYDPARALKLAERAVEIDRTSATFWNTLGVARLRNNRSDAAEAFQRSIDGGSSGNEAFDWFPLAIVLSRRGDAARARQLYDQAVDWVDKHPMTKNDPDLLQLQSEARTALGLPAPAPEAPARAKTSAPAQAGPA